MGTDLVVNNLLQKINELIARVDALEKADFHVSELTGDRKQRTVGGESAVNGPSRVDRE